MLNTDQLVVMMIISGS